MFCSYLKVGYVMLSCIPCSRGISPSCTPVVDNLMVRLHTVICVANSNCFQNVRRPTGRSEFAWRTAHSTVKFVFINHNLCVTSGVRTFSARFCAYASFINETPGPTLFQSKLRWSIGGGSKRIYGSVSIGWQFIDM